MGQEYGQSLAGSAQYFTRLQSRCLPGLSSCLEAWLEEDLLLSSLRLLSDSFSCGHKIHSSLLTKRWQQKERLKAKQSLKLCSITPGLASYHFCHIAEHNCRVSSYRLCHTLFVRQKSCDPPTFKEQGLHKDMSIKRWGSGCYLKVCS